MHNGIPFLFFSSHSVPHPDTGSAGIGKYGCTDLCKCIQEAVSFDGVTHQFTAWSDGEFSFGFQSLFCHLFCKAYRTADVFIGWIGAAANQANFNLGRPVVFCSGLFHLWNRCGKVWRKGAIEVWLQLTEVDLNYLVKIFFRVGIHFVIAGQIRLYCICCCCNVSPSRWTEVPCHAFVISEGWGRGPDFSTHVTDGAFSGTTHAGCTFAKIFNNGVGSTFYSKNTSHLKDYILGWCPAIQFPRQFYTNQFGHQEFPAEASHYITCIRAANTNGHHAQSTSIHGMGVRTNHHSAGECIVFQYNLVDDTCTGLPEANAIFIWDGRQEFIYFLIFCYCFFEVGFAFILCHNQVITMNRWRDCHLFATSSIKL